MGKILWKVRVGIARLIIGEDEGIANLCLLQALRYSGKIQGNKYIISHKVKNISDGSITYQTTIHEEF